MAELVKASLRFVKKFTDPRVSVLNIQLTGSLNENHNEPSTTWLDKSLEGHPYMIRSNEIF
jgi:hypothetical protein